MNKYIFLLGNMKRVLIARETIFANNVGDAVRTLSIKMKEKNLSQHHHVILETICDIVPHKPIVPYYRRIGDISQKDNLNEPNRFITF